MNKKNYLNLILQLALTDFKLKYAGSILGYLWSLVKPLLFFGILYVVFTYVFRLGKGIPNYPVYLLLGVVMWAFFAEATMGGMHAIVNRGDLIRKVNFPKIIIVLAAVLNATTTFLLNMVIVFVFLFFSKIDPTLNVVIFIPLILEFILFVLGVSLILGTLFTKFRDFAHIWEVSLQLLFYATPIIYPISLIPSQFTKFVFLNPIAQMIQDSRWAIISNAIPTAWNMFSYKYGVFPIVVAFCTLVVGLIFFKFSAKNFAEEI